MQKIDLTGTTDLGIILLNEKSSYDIVLIKEDNGVASDFPTANWRCNIYDQTDETSLLMMSAGNGFDVVGNTMTIKRNVVQNELPNGNYGLEIRGDFVDGTNIIPFIAVVKIQKRITGL
jgi:hypothetical protein